MKKFLSVMFAVMFAFSALAVGASADRTVNVTVDGTEDGATYTCELCGATFTSPVLRDEHLASQNPVEGHNVTCGILVINDEGKVVECDKTFESRAALADHQAACGEKLIDLAVAYFKSGDIVNGLKYLVKAIIEFFQSETFAKIVEVLGKVVDVVKGIDFGGIISTIKGVAEKIPMDKIVDAAKGIVG